MKSNEQKANLAASIGQQPRVNITQDMIKNSQTLKCVECGGVTFKEKMLFKKISAILSPTGKEELLPISGIFCENCGKAISELDPYGLIPEELKAIKSY